MGISKVSNRWLNRAYKCIAILLVVFAVLISSLRLFLPYAHNFKIELQDYINTTYESNIVIGSLNMGWQSTGPSLVATNVSVLQTDAAEVYVQALNMSVDFWASLKSRRLITKDIMLDGMKVLFDKSMLADTSASKQDTILLDNLTESLLTQIGRFSIKNSQVIYRTGAEQRTFLISSLYWLNSDNKHKARGNVIVDGLTSNNLQLNLDAEGDTISEMKGVLYLEANQLNITPWLDKVLAIEDENTHSTINFDAWLTIENGLAKQLQVALGQNQIAWQHNESIRTFNVESGQVIFEHLDAPSKLKVYSSNIKIRSDEQVWQPLNFEIKENFGALQGYISTIDIAGITDLLPLFITDEKPLILVEQLNPVGLITDVYFDFTDEKIASIAQFSQVTTEFNQGIPGIENVSGEIVLNGQQLQIDFQAEQGVLDFDKHFFEPIPYQSLSSTLNFQYDNESWQLTSDNVNFISEQVKLKSQLGVFAEQGKDVELSLLATATEGNAIYAQTFYPHLLMGNDLVEYLNGALLQGEIEQALVLINGPISHFPFEDDSGVFVVDAELTEATFKFDQNWPAINHFDANLNFTNNSMVITGRDGSLSGIDVTGVKAGIADLADEQILTVEANFSDTAPELVSNLMLTSPFDESIGAVLEQVVISENISGNFSLTLPLNNTDAALAKGDINFDNNTIALQAPEMHFTQVSGVLRYENEKINADELNLRWREKPLTLEVNADNKALHYQTNIAIDADWQAENWLTELPTTLQQYGNQSLPWQGELVINNFHDGQFSYQLDILSDLGSTELNLPAPFNKHNNDLLQANIKVSGDEDQSTIDAEIGEQFKFYGNLNHQQVAFLQAHLILGHEEMYLPMSGFHITTNLEQAIFEQWQPFVSDIIASLPDNDSVSDEVSLLEQPQRIRGNVGQLNFFGESLHGVSFNLEDELSWWLLELSSKEARGKVKFFPDWHQQGLEVDADFVHLAPKKLLFAKTELAESDGEAVAAKEETITNDATFDISSNDDLFKDIPPMRVTCEACTYGNLNLGKVTFSLDRESDKLITLNNFVAQRKRNKLTFDAKWHHDSQLSTTQIVGDFDSKDIEREFERLSLQSTVRDSGLKTTFDINWIGGPQNFSLASFSGDIHGKLDDGYLAEVPDQARAFSLLSLQSLVRKLRFDFRDIFSDGMFYSEVKGDFQIKNGVVYTKNTFLKGSAGDLSVKGNTDLNKEILDYSMSYKPNVTSSLPAIAWIATLNPVTFLAGIAIDEVITSKIVSEYKFEVTGSIQEPNFKEVDRKTQNISVGRDSPPQIVENLPVAPEVNIGKINPETGLIENHHPDKTDG